MKGHIRKDHIRKDHIRKDMLTVKKITFLASNTASMTGYSSEVYETCDKGDDICRVREFIWMDGDIGDGGKLYEFFGMMVPLLLAHVEE